MKRTCGAISMCFVLLEACSGAHSGRAVELPGGEPGIGFDDLRYSTTLHRLLVPAGRSGRLDLIESESLEVTSIEGFSAQPKYSGGHDDGATSVDEGLGHLYVTDRTSRKVWVVDAQSRAIVASAALGASPDYVRFVAMTNELWVTEPSADRIEIFKLNEDATPVTDGLIPVDNGPESIVVDNTRGRVYTHRWQKTTVAIDIASRSIVAEWPNGCAASRGIALDEARGWLFSGCNEGTAAVLDVAHDGAVLSVLARGSGFDVIGYNSVLRHLALAGEQCACLMLLAVTSAGKLAFLERTSAPASTHCAATDDVGHAWVCDPDGGKLWRIDDKHGALP